MKLASLLALAALLAVYAPRAQAADSAPVRISLVAKGEAKSIPADFSGLSFETQRLLPGKERIRFFRPDNLQLITLFKTLGIQRLRIGGNTADRPSVPVPSVQDIDSLFAFARAAGVKVVYTLRLRDGDPRKAATLAKYIVNNHADALLCFAIGNEPNVFAPEYPKFIALWKQFADVVNSPEFAPSARFAGPSATAGKSAWTADFAREFAGTGRVLAATQHIYPGGNADLVTDPAAGRELMLSREWVDGYQKFHDGFVPAVLATGIPFRLEETNSFWNGGRKDASNTFTAALWALDYMHWWASHSAAGMNFHTGDFVAKAEENTRCMYAVFWSTKTGYEAKPLAYALKAFSTGIQGQLAEALIEENPKNVNITAYAVRDGDLLTLTLINKEHGAEARNAELVFPTRPGTEARMLRLVTPDGDIARTDGITLGNGSIKEDGTWDGQWAPAPADSQGLLQLTVPAASAVVLKFTLP